MKKKNIVGLIASVLSLVVFALSFAVRAVINDHSEGHYKRVVFLNSVWGCTQLRAYEDGKLWNITEMKGGVSPFPIIGFILVLIIGIIALLAIIFSKSNNRKWVLLTCGVLSAVSSVFQFLGGESTIVAYAKYYNESVDSVRKLLRESGAIAWPGVLGIILAVVTILIGAALILVAFLPDKSEEEQ